MAYIFSLLSACLVALFLRSVSCSAPAGHGLEAALRQHERRDIDYISCTYYTEAEQPQLRDKMQFGVMETISDVTIFELSLRSSAVSDQRLLAAAAAMNCKNWRIETDIGPYFTKKDTSSFTFAVRNWGEEPAVFNSFCIKEGINCFVRPGSIFKDCVRFHFISGSRFWTSFNIYTYQGTFG